MNLNRKIGLKKRLVPLQGKGKQYIYQNGILGCQANTPLVKLRRKLEITQRKKT